MKRGSERRKFSEEFKTEVVRLPDPPGMGMSQHAAAGMTETYPATKRPRTPWCKRRPPSNPGVGHP